ncbi:MAG TPA: sigma-70 family RNA polymerase sigma factor, partial [Bryobacteraceae bacterium]|nr:sigma-70 family RNA polymerase sigma factor [Bryobacteraceae bacterium]
NNQFETDLIETIRAGNSQFFDDLMQPYSRRLLQMARCALRNDADAEDVVQEVQLKVFTGLGQFRGEARFSSWLYRIMFNEIRQYRRRNPARLIVSLDDADQIHTAGADTLRVAPDVLETLDAERTRATILAILNRLPAGLRSAVVMYHLQELPVAATAARMGMTQGATKSRLVRARKRMHSAWTSRVRIRGGHDASETHQWYS